MKAIFTLIITLFSFAFGYSQQIWHPVNFYPPGESNAIGAICPIDENLVYAVSDQKFYKSLDSGTSWVSIDLNIPETFFDLVFFDANLGFAIGTNGTILKTVDAGTTWSTIPTGTTEDLFSMAMISLNDIWVVGSQGTVLHSTNGGNTWALDNSLTTEKLNSVKFYGNIGFIAGNNATLLHTSDYGITWTPVSLSTTDDLFSLNVTENNTQFLAGNAPETYPGFNNGFVIFKTTDNINWLSYPVINDRLVTSKLYFQNDNLGFLLSSAKALCNCSDLEIYRTIDGGQSWELSYCASGGSDALEGGYSDLAAANDTIIYAFNNDHIFQTTNAGANWGQNPCDAVYGIEEFELSNFTIYPNPVKGSGLHLEFKNVDVTTLSAEIIAISGKQVSFFQKINENQIDVSGLEEGLYFLNILKNGKIVGSKKFIRSNP